MRRGTAAEIDLVYEQRAAMFRDMGLGTPDSREEMSARFAPWAIERFASGEFLQWFAEVDGAVAGGAPPPG